MACKRACMRFLFLLLMLLLLVTEAVEGKKKGGRKGRRGGGRRKRGCEDVAQNKPVEAVVGKILNITCKSESKIFEFNVTSSKSGTSCRGWQAHMLVQSNTCIGQGSCLNLNLSNTSPIIKSHNETCIGHNPDRVEVSVICTKRLGVEKMDPGQETARQGIRAEQGIVASPVYPWQYSHDKPQYQVRFSHGGGKTFSYTLHKLDLGEGDTLEVRGRQERTYDSKRHPMPLDGHVTGSDVTLTLKQGGDTPGDGFILCYKWADKPVTDVCKELTEPPESMTACIPNKRRDRNNRRRERKNGKKKNGGKKKSKKRKREGGRRKGRRNRQQKTMTTTIIPSV